jgi:hypothetical protein
MALLTLSVLYGFVATRQQLENKPRGMLDVAREIVEEDGITGLWNGIKVRPSFSYVSFLKSCERTLTRQLLHQCSLDSF